MPLVRGDRVGEMAELDRRRWLLGGALLFGAALLVVMSPWAIWPIDSAAVWLGAIGLVVFVAVRLALRGR